MQRASATCFVMLLDAPPHHTWTLSIFGPNFLNFVKKKFIGIAVQGPVVFDLSLKLFHRVQSTLVDQGAHGYFDCRSFELRLG